MTSDTPKKFLVLYLIPSDVLAGWAKTDAAIRAPAEQKMQADWGRWMGEHASMISVTEAAGKTKVVTSAGIADVKNDIILYSIVEAKSQDDAAAAFASHPHLTIPQASIQVMAVRAMGSAP